jgi:hypothetical protein
MQDHDPKQEETEVALRAFLVHKSEKGSYSYATEKIVAPDIVAVIDTETTNDTFLNFKFGSFGIWVAGRLHRFIIFYSDNLLGSEVQVLRAFGGKQIESVRREVMPLSRFVDEVFYPVVYDGHARLAGFNLPFDLSRLATHYGFGRRNWKGGFTFTLSKNNFRPPIHVRSLDSTKAFIEFARPPKRNRRHSRSPYKGRFVDLRTLGFALTNEKLTLELACEHFQTSHRKTRPSSHGKITSEYVEYNINDVLSTHDVYVNMIRQYDSFHLTLTPEKAYSPASIGKQYLKQMGIKSFLEQNPDFSPEVLGYIMTTFYGGRSEVRIRKKPVKVRYMDFTSMYPSLFSLMHLWRFLIAERIECVEATGEIRRLVKRTDLQILRSPDLWQNMVAIVQIQPNGDTLPVRARYGDNDAYNIGINRLTSSEPLWFTLPEILAAKLLKGKSPEILRAIRLVPQGRQSGLAPTKILGESIVNPKEDLFLRLRQLRKKTQSERDQQSAYSRERQMLDTIQNELKIIANAASYGIYIEVNTEDRQCEPRVYGLEHFQSETSKTEKFGGFFNPIISTMLTSGARLLLAMAESWLTQHGGYHAFCDTDGIAVSPFHWKKLQQLFEPLNPMPGEPFLKLEKDNHAKNNELRDLWFYGISAKRYVLYYLDGTGEPIPVKWSSHGLGHLMHEKENEWEKRLWANILCCILGKTPEKQLFDRYTSEYATAKLAITTPHLLRRVKPVNKGKQMSQQIKPYNFVLVGSPVMVGRRGDPIIPITPFTTRLNHAPYQPFIDAKTGKLYEENTQLYWKKLDKTVEDYIDHPESKFDNGNHCGTMVRRHLTVQAVRYIGKESNELEDVEILGVNNESYLEYSRDVEETATSDFLAK